MAEPTPAPAGATPQLDRPATGPGALCAWCGEPIPELSETGRRTRSDALCCGKTCRQASWRFGTAKPSAPVQDAAPASFAYADPPYPGMSARYYSEHPDFGGEVNHAELIARLLSAYPDGWALSTSSKTLRHVLSLIPLEVEVRIHAWTKPMPPGKARRARCAWEPVIFYGGRPRPDDAPTILDWIHAATPRALPGQVVGTKPSQFAYWLFDCLGAQPGDQLADLFPGSGAIGRAWERWSDPSRPAGGLRRVA